MNPLISVYDFHKKEFGLEKNIFLRLFEEVLSTTPCSLLECSVKISREDTHALRLRLGYEQSNIQSGFHAMYGLLNKIAGCENVCLNRDILGQIVSNNLDISRIMALGLGLDCKSNIKNSKVKCYFLLREYPEKVDQVILLHPPLDDIHDYLIHDEFGFGIVMYFDGRKGVEIYPCFDCHDLNNTELMEKLKLRDVVWKFIEECDLLYISFERDGRRLLHFNPRRPSRFVRLLNNRRLSLTYSHVQTLNYILSRSYKTAFVSVSLCLREDEINARDIQNISLHYGLSCGAWKTRQASHWCSV
jgi:LynF/TruF/PatF family peptide O-prenyltransferase